MTTYTTVDRDRLDRICYRHYGRSGVTPRVLEANPGLAAKGPLLPAGLTIQLPDLGPRPTTPAIRPTLKLWE